MTVLIIGGSGGIGGEVIQALISQKVHVINIDKEPANICSEMYTEFIIELTANVIESSFKQILERHSPIDGFISAIGYYGVNNLAGFSPDEYKKTMAINVEIPMLCVMHVVEKMIAQNHGKLVFISSAAAYVGSRDIPYSISKAAIIGLVKGLSKNLIGINVYTYGVAPGIVETSMSSRMSFDRQNDAVCQTINKRMCTPLEVAKLVRFLLLDDAGYMNGSIVHINDGLYLN